jgi:Domain of unknown function (DUF4383)
MRQDTTPAQLYAGVLGAVLLLVGIAGFLVNAKFAAGPRPPGDDLLLFKVNGWHNIVHIASGAAGLALARTAAGGRAFALGFGIVYGVVTAYGLVAGTNVLGLVAVNGADNVHHLLIAATGLAAYAASRSTPAPAAPVA